MNKSPEGLNQKLREESTHQNQTCGTHQTRYKHRPSDTSLFYKYMPNSLTILRLLGTPLIVWVIAHNHLTAAFWIFFAISVTDWLDGYLARRWQATSKLGQILDPIADKFFLISIYFTLGLWEKIIPSWLTALVLIRDFLILIIGSSIILVHKGNVHLSPQLIGKISTTLQMTFIGFVLINGVPIPSFPTSSIHSNLMVLFLYIVASVTILSGITYARIALSAFQK